MKYISEIIMFITMIFMLLGALDKILGNRWGYAKEFDKGILASGHLMLAAAAVMAIAPVLSEILIKFILPFFEFINVDPSLFPAMILCSDMGGYSLAIQLAQYENIGLYNGLVVAGIMGATFTFTIPLALVMLEKADRKIFIAGILTGISCIPIGCFFGGLAMILTPYSIHISQIINNLLPIIVVSFVVVVGLLLFPDTSIRFFSFLGTTISQVIIALTAIAIFQQVTHIYFPFFKQMVVTTNDMQLSYFDEGLLTCGKIGIILAGAFPMVLWITRVLEKPLLRLSIQLGINIYSVTGLLASSTNYAAGFGCFKDMDKKGKYLNTAYLVSGGCVIGDLLGFTAGINSQLLLPMIIGKLCGGISAFILAYYLAPRLTNLFD